MNFLAIDTTTKSAQVLVSYGGKTYYKEIENEITHSEKLMPLIDDVLTTNNISLSNLESLICIIGPGSFTGVRIGLATIKAMAKALDKKIFGTTSLELLAASALVDNENMPEYILPLIDAKNERAYYHLYKLDNGKLYPTEIYGNDYITTILDKISDEKYSDLLYVLDNETLVKYVSKYSYKVTKGDLNNITSKYISLKEYSYLDLDAAYYRKSEAERTRAGE